MNENLTDDQLRQMLKRAKALSGAIDKDRLFDFTPYDPQKRFMSSKAHQRVLYGGNRSGKTHCASFEISCHLTGRYPKWWDGIRFNNPIDIWVVGESSGRVRDTVQSKILGRPGNYGTGWLNAEDIDVEHKIMKGNPAHCVDIMPINYTSGGQSTIQFFSYDQDVDKLQGSSVKLVWFDEEPPVEHYNESRMRVLDNNGYLLFTFTPLKGMTPLILQIEEDEYVDKYWLTWDDVSHLDEDAKKQLTSGMSAEEKNARMNGLIIGGSSIIFPYPEEDYSCDSFELPRHWPRVGGIDIGLNHPTCAHAVALDRDSDTAYVYQEYVKTGEIPPVHANTLKHWGVKFALSHDAFNRSSQTGKTTADVYKSEGLDVFNAGKDPWSRIEQIKSRIGTGRLFVFKDKCPILMREMKVYRTDKNGKIVKVGDDAVDSFSHAVAHLDQAEVSGAKKKPINIIIPEWKPFDTRLGV